MALVQEYVANCTYSSLAIQVQCTIAVLYILAELK